MYHSKKSTREKSWGRNECADAILRLYQLQCQSFLFPLRKSEEVFSTTMISRPPHNLINGSFSFDIVIFINDMMKICMVDICLFSPQNGVSVGPDAAERATADDAVGRAHQRHDRHVRARGDHGGVRDLKIRSHSQS